MKKNFRPLQFGVLLLFVFTVTNLLATYYWDEGNKSSWNECNENSWCEPLAWDYCYWWCSTFTYPNQSYCMDVFYVTDRCDWDTHYCGMWYKLLCTEGQFYPGWLCERFSWDCVSQGNQ